MTRIVTPGYAPPEQYLGSGRFGPATDVYGLAATLYRLLTAKVPLAARRPPAGHPAGAAAPAQPRGVEARQRRGDGRARARRRPPAAVDRRVPRPGGHRAASPVVSGPVGPPPPVAAPPAPAPPTAAPFPRRSDPVAPRPARRRHPSPPAPGARARRREPGGRPGRRPGGPGRGRLPARPGRRPTPAQPLAGDAARRCRRGRALTSAAPVLFTPLLVLRRGAGARDRRRPRSCTGPAPRGASRTAGSTARGPATAGGGPVRPQPRRQRRPIAARARWRSPCWSRSGTRCTTSARLAGLSDWYLRAVGLGVGLLVVVPALRGSATFASGSRSTRCTGGSPRRAAA